MLNTAAVTFQFVPNLTGSFMELAFTGDKCHEDICTGNVCLGHTFYSSHFDTGKTARNKSIVLARTHPKGSKKKCIQDRVPVLSDDKFNIWSSPPSHSKHMLALAKL